MNDQTQPVTLQSRAARFARKELVPLALVIFGLLTFRSAVADWYDVPTGSMRPTILEGDRIIVNKMAYDLRIPFFGTSLIAWDNPERGEIVILYSPKTGERLVKRVIGLPGDTVELRGDVLAINGQELMHGAIDAATLSHVPQAERIGRLFASEALPSGPSHALTITPGRPALRVFGPVTVGPGEYIVMGDNRDESADSRYFGSVPRDKIVGRSSRIGLSLDRARWWLPRWSRFGKRLDP